MVLLRVAGFITELAPIGVFSIAASTAGAISLDGTAAGVPDSRLLRRIPSWVRRLSLAGDLLHAADSSTALANRHGAHGPHFRHRQVDHCSAEKMTNDFGHFAD